MESLDMDVFEKFLQEASPIELATLVEAYSDDEVFEKYMEFRELSDDPLNLAEYLAERREWEYES